jgi:hypothetical protein
VTSLGGVTLFTTGIRVSILAMLIVVLWRSIRVKVTQEDLYSKIAHNPRIILSLVVTLLLVSLAQVTIELYDHWRNQ